MSILSVNHLTKIVNHQMVLDEVSFEINAPGIWALVAPSGSGKTTLLRTICHLQAADSGTVELVGKSNQDRSVYKEVVYLQNPSILHDDLTGYDHLKYICTAHNIHKSRINEVVKDVGIQGTFKKKIRHHTFSSKQLLLLAMALISKSKLLLLDEPFTGLDSSSISAVQRIFHQLKENGSSILFTSPDLTSIHQITPHIYFLKNGKLTEINSKHYESTYYRLHVSSPTTVKQILEDENYLVEEDGECLLVYLEHKPLHRLMELLMSHQINIIDVQKESHNLEQQYKEHFE
ncbi:ATP-binding cassette domain-containing protein [Alkalicoccobacillus porphyridii]|uniref:ATP-binding cassette domain-containing protein n=1 Tax=Alkalicoccobacillus porphyridii TaxID=2597270 RepID=UPI00163DA9AB|nr:ABC transporter ATP-binding protein [Alkalicoccobacillus porphyridii]